MSRKETGRFAPLRTVLVPTDFSPGARQALGRALRLPLAEGATIQLLHVLPRSLPARVRAQATADARQALTDQAATARATVRGRPLRIETDLATGEAFVEIIRRARRHGTELIVLGRHGQRPLRDMFIGSCADRVIRKGDVPVLVVNLRPARPYCRPLIATDLGDAAPRTIDLALRVLGPATREVGVVHAFRVPFEGFLSPARAGREASDYRQEYRRQSAARLAALLGGYAGHRIHWQKAMPLGDARAIILEEAGRRRADLIALGTHGRAGVAHALLGSVAEWVIRTARCDVLVARTGRFSFELP